MCRCATSDGASPYPPFDPKGPRKKNKAAALAGLVRGKSNPDGSVHALKIVLEPEAASLYCLYKIKNGLAKQYLKADEFVP